MCTVLLPPGDNPIEVNKYIISYLFTLSKKQATAVKPPKIFPQTMYTCSQLATAKRKRIQTLYGEDLCQPSIHIAEQLHVWMTLQTKNKTFPLNINQPMPDDQFIFSSFWLPSPRFELGPWPVTVPNVKSLVKINSTCCWDFQMRYDGYQRTNKTCLNWG